MEYYNEFYHSGVKGMKWGVRKYQNKDGTLTDAGKKRYARDAREKEYGKYDESSGKYYKNSKKGRNELEVDANRYVTEDIERTKRIADSSANLSRELKRVNDNSIRRQPKDRLDLSDISDQELRNKINRELLERQYNDVFNPPQISKGKAFASKMYDVTTDALTLTGAALTVALAYRQFAGGKE